MTRKLTGKVAFVTGATSGIGLACAQRFVEEGGAVVGLDIKNSDEWQLLEQSGDHVLLVVADVTDEAAQKHAAAMAVERYGRIDILVTAAGIAEAGPVHMVEQDAWDRVLNINVKGTYLSIKAVIPTMLEQCSGNIITIGSIEGLVGSEGGSAYNASKGAVVLLTKNVAMDYGRKGIRCNCICPGFIETPLFRDTIDLDFMQDYKQLIQADTKMGRFGKPEEVAGVAYFLASDDASYVTGQSLPVDGGYTAGHSHGLVKLMGLD
ncbi:MAG: SDR family oxidoreductase [Halieaceae bacterium]|jgi:NAD(P)-dependent dehydrogenase (short-subunit alcohol dehydrogenase family)|nr:SDR family oxidoreductase [Halieaceae bacterium]